MLWLQIIGFLLLLLVLLLCLPITVKLALQLDGELSLTGRVVWGLVPIKKIHIEPGAQPSSAPSRPPTETKAAQPQAEPAPAKTRPSASQAEPQQPRRQRRSLTWSTVRPLVQKYLPRCWRALHLRTIEADMHLTVNDPACYGWLFGFFAAVHWPQEPVRLYILLDDDNDFRATARWRAHIYPVEWLWLGLSLAREETIRPLWQGKWRKKGEKKHGRSETFRGSDGKPRFQQDSHRGTDISG